MIKRLNTYSHHLMLLTALVTLGFAASASIAQAQCSPEDCLTREKTAVETITVDVLPIQPVPVAALSALPAESEPTGQNLPVCEVFPDCRTATVALRDLTFHRAPWSQKPFFRAERIRSTDALPIQPVPVAALSALPAEREPTGQNLLVCESFPDC